MPMSAMSKEHAREALKRRRKSKSSAEKKKSERRQREEKELLHQAPLFSRIGPHSLGNQTTRVED